MGRRNPNGYGCVTMLKGRRSCPWMARVTVYDKEGRHHQKPIGYAETKSDALKLLAKYNEQPWQIDRNSVTFSDLYERWLEVKAPSLGKSTIGSCKAAYNHCQRLYGMKYMNIKSYHMQICIDECDRSASVKQSIRTLFFHLDKFAFEIDIISKMYSQLVKVDAVQPGSKREPFSKDQIRILWQHTDDRMIRIILVYIYTGFRLNELLQMKSQDVDTSEWLMTGGEKTTSGKNRIVPVCVKIRPLVEGFLQEGNEYLISQTDGKPYLSSAHFRDHFNASLSSCGLPSKVPHECRHTFETLLDDAGANRKCIDLLMGHASKDIGNRVYNHKTIEQLRDAVKLLETV